MARDLDVKHCLTLVGGWPGAGKSTLCDAFAQVHDATIHFDKDIVTSVLAEAFSQCILDRHTIVLNKKSRKYR